MAARTSAAAKPKTHRHLAASIRVKVYEDAEILAQVLGIRLSVLTERALENEIRALDNADAPPEVKTAFLQVKAARDVLRASRGKR